MFGGDSVWTGGLAGSLTERAAGSGGAQCAPVSEPTGGGPVRGWLSAPEQGPSSELWSVPVRVLGEFGAVSPVKRSARLGHCKCRTGAVSVAGVGAATAETRGRGRAEERQGPGWRSRDGAGVPGLTAQAFGDGVRGPLTQAEVATLCLARRQFASDHERP